MVWLSGCNLVVHHKFQTKGTPVPDPRRCHLLLSQRAGSVCRENYPQFTNKQSALVSNSWMKAAPLLAAALQLLTTAGLVRAQGRAVTEFDFTAADGTVIRGEYQGTDIPVKTSFGMVPVPTRAIERIQPAGDGKQILLVLRNGDEVVGIPSQPGIPLSTGDGLVRVDLRRSEGIDVCFFAESSRQRLEGDLEVHFTFEQGSGSKHST